MDGYARRRHMERIVDGPTVVCWLIGLAVWLFIGALVEVDSRRRYGRHTSTRATWVWLFGVLAVPFYLVYRVGHEPLSREERYRRGVEAIERMWASGVITEEGYEGRLVELRHDLGMEAVEGAALGYRK